jgi:hypothetical protein
MTKNEKYLTGVGLFIVATAITVLILVNRPINYDYGTDTGGGNMEVTDNITTAQGALNNPGNIRKTSIPWEGKIDSASKNFESFSSMAYGYRDQNIAELLQSRSFDTKGNDFNLCTFQ